MLSIDGGGVRGIFAAKVLSLIETELHMNIHELFDLIVGTSTGSIIAAAIFVKYDLTRLGVPRLSFTFFSMSTYP